MSAVTLMRWHVELKHDITEYILTLRRLSWNYDVRLDIKMLICILYMNKTINNNNNNKTYIKPISIFLFSSALKT